MICAASLHLQTAAATGVAKAVLCRIAIAFPILSKYSPSRALNLTSVSSLYALYVVIPPVVMETLGRSVPKLVSMGSWYSDFFI